MSDKFICSSCSYVIDERVHSIPDIGPMSYPPEGLGHRPACPLCGGDRELFRPCDCAPQPTMPAEKRGLDVERLAALAQYEAHLCESNRFFKVPLRLEVRPLARILHEMQEKALDARELAIPDVISGSAYDLLLAHSANYYWFCRILAFAAGKSSRLPLLDSEIEQAIQEITGQLGREFLDTRPISNFSHWETAAGVVRGALLLEPSQDGTYRLVLNSVYGFRPHGSYARTW